MRVSLVRFISGIDISDLIRKLMQLNLFLPTKSFFAIGTTFLPPLITIEKLEKCAASSNERLAAALSMKGLVSSL